MKKEIEQLSKFLLSESTEKAKDHLAFPLFQKIFGKKFKKESDAEGADIYIEGKLVVELKTKVDDVIRGFFQALHYEKKGLTFSSVCVISYQYIGLWNIKDIPIVAKEYASKADAMKAASEVGVLNANKTKKIQRAEIFKSARFAATKTEFDSLFKKDSNIALYEFVQQLKNLDSARLQINTFNFIQKIELLKKYFDNPIDAIHCFYAYVGFWDATSTVAEIGESGKIQIVGCKGTKTSEAVYIKPNIRNDFKKFIERHYVFTNEGSGLTVDYYFSRFDEVIARTNPDYAKQHGIFFTDSNLSKFALWFVHKFYEKKLSDKYIVLDPAGGSGNLVSSWHGHLKHKVISELQPDLLKTIERRMKLDPDHIKMGFTIIPKTSENVGLNFLDKSAEKYIDALMSELSIKNMKLDKPIAFLLNPPYKNTDENVKERTGVEASYDIHSTILDLTGKDAGNERYLAFLGQILNIARIQTGDIKSTELNLDQVCLPPVLDAERVETPLILIFTPTSWLIPRPTYKKFRRVFDKYFRYEMGFIFLGKEFFKIKGSFPIAFTIWSYNKQEDGNHNQVKVRDFTNFKKTDLDINWNQQISTTNNYLKQLMSKHGTVNLSQQRESIKDWTGQTMYDFKRDPTKAELNSSMIYGGLPKRDPRRENKKTYGEANSQHIGFMDNNTPVRLKPDKRNRLSTICDRVWFRLDNDLKSGNKTRVVNGPPDKYGYVALDLESAKKTFAWYAITKCILGKYPVWANQFDLWKPDISSEKEIYFYSLCFSLVLAENGCVVTKFEADNPVKGTPEVFVDNPLCPTNPNSFWSTTLDAEIVDEPSLAKDLADDTKKLYELWNQKYCKGQVIQDVGLEDEPYFKYFDYPDFVTPYSGLIQIRKYANVFVCSDLFDVFDQISEKTKKVKEEIYRLLVEEFKYFK